MISEDDFTLFLYESDGNYTIYTKDGNVSIRYSYPIDAEARITYDGDFTINNHSVNIVFQNGTLTPPYMIQHMFEPRPINSLEKVQVCYNFSLERITLKVTVGLLVLLFLLSHGPKGWTVIQTIGEDLLQSQFARRFSRRRSPVAGST